MDVSIPNTNAKEPISESTQAKQSHEVTFIQQEVIIYSTSSSNPKDVPPINYVALVALTE